LANQLFLAVYVVLLCLARMGFRMMIDTRRAMLRMVIESN
jgi:hypothetical protein